MSIIGIIIISITAFYALAAAYYKFHEERGVHERNLDLHCVTSECLKKYTIEHGYDLRANKLIQEKRPQIQKLNRYSVEYAKAMGDLLYEVLSPYKRYMTRDELRAYRAKDWMKMNAMVQNCLNPSPRFDGIHF